MPSPAVERVAPVWFRSKVDGWLAAVLVGAPIFTVVTVVGAGRAAEDVAWPLLVIPVVVMVAIYGLFLFPMRYGITSDELVVRSGVIVEGCRLGDIREVRPTRSPLSAPALSLDRLEIRYGTDDVVVISPREREAFLALLGARAGLARQGDGLVRRT